MNSTELLENFRSELYDLKKPYLWSDEEVFRYMNSAYRMFFRLTGGISDFITPDVCEVAMTANDPLGVLHDSVLRIMSARRQSDNGDIEVVNSTDLGKLTSQDYGQVKSMVLDTRTGTVRYMVQGMKKGSVRWVQVPEKDDVCLMHVYRMPLDTISDFEQELSELEDDHHEYLLHWMKHLAFRKQDADTFNSQASEKGKVDFETYCKFVKAEWERYKHKTRTVAYGGL